MDKEPYSLEEFESDCLEFIFLVFFCCLGIGLFYLIFRYWIDLSAATSFGIAFIGGSIWALYGYALNYYNVDTYKILHMPLFKKEKHKPKKQD